jgi:hypothetical protein
MTKTDAPVAAITVRELRESDAERWNRFLTEHPDSNLYHTLRWRDFVREVFGHQPLYLLAESGGKVAGVLPMFLVKAPLLGSNLISMPYDIGSGGALASDAATEFALVQRAVELANHIAVDYIQLRYSSLQPELETLGFQPSDPVIISDMEIRGEEQHLWSKVKDSERRAVMQAQRRGLVVREGRSLEDFRDFEQIILRLFREFGTPPYGPRYFETLWRKMHASGDARIVLAHVERKCVAGLLLFCSGHILIAKIGGCLPEALPVRATAALYWRSIQLAIQLGRRKLSWGTSSHDQSGLIRFKERWGAQSHRVAVYSMAIRGKIPDLARYYDSTGIERRIWRKLPIPLTRLGGAALSRWFC